MNRCRHVAEGCPGCTLIAAPYETQLAAKTAAVRKVLAPMTKAVNAIVPSPQQWHYRERGTFVQQGAVVGLRTATGKVVDVPECQVVSLAIARCMSCGASEGLQRSAP